MAIVFDGKAYSLKKKKILRNRVGKISSSNRPQLVSILVGNNPSSRLYVNIKKKFAKDIGVKAKVEEFSKNSSKGEIIGCIEKLNKDPKVGGILVQLPLPDSFSKQDRDQIISVIDPQKDVDGMLDNSIFVSPVVKSVIEVLSVADQKLGYFEDRNLTICVVGYSGYEGKKIFKSIRQMGYKVIGIDKKTINYESKILKADIIISVTGVPNIIKPALVKDGVVLIDVGSPGGDIDRYTYQKASFVSPTPGGIGPMTVSNLLENLILSWND